MARRALAVLTQCTERRVALQTLEIFHCFVGQLCSRCARKVDVVIVHFQRESHNFISGTFDKIKQPTMSSVSDGLRLETSVVSTQPTMPQLKMKNQKKRTTRAGLSHRGEKAK